MAPRETENNAYAKFWGDKQRVLWYVMVFSGGVNSFRFLLFMFLDQLLFVDMFSQLYYLTDAKKKQQQCRTYRYKSLKS